MSQRRKLIERYFGVIRGAEARRILARGMCEQDRRVMVALADIEEKWARRMAGKIIHGV
jgi:hypothetical protein